MAEKEYVKKAKRMHGEKYFSHLSKEEKDVYRGMEIFLIVSFAFSSGYPRHRRSIQIYVHGLEEGNRVWWRDQNGISMMCTTRWHQNLFQLNQKLKEHSDWMDSQTEKDKEALEEKWFADL